MCEMVAIEIDTDDLENIIGTLTDAITNMAEKVSGLTDLLENMEDERECVSNAVNDLQTAIESLPDCIADGLSSDEVQE
ncbi:MAG: hypothetical protein GX268_07260 [Methanomicrobiales archaeon]|nr:hypothetical protein [Methanomicrobiales archaeon]